MKAGAGVLKVELDAGRFQNMGAHLAQDSVELYQPRKITHGEVRLADWLRDEIGAVRVERAVLVEVLLRPEVDAAEDDAAILQAHSEGDDGRERRSVLEEIADTGAGLEESASLEKSERVAELLLVARSGRDTLKSEEILAPRR